MSPREVLDLLGAPDYVGFKGWEYDGSERTLRVTWANAGGWFNKAGRGSVVNKVEELVPPVWVDPNARLARLV